MHSMGETLVISVGQVDLEYTTMDGPTGMSWMWSSDRQEDHTDGVG